MTRSWVVGIVVAIVFSSVTASCCFAQAPKGKELDRERDEALREFAGRVRKIALQYEQAGDREKARSTLRMLLQTTPNDAEARAILDRISRQELTENKTIVKVMANQGWQNTGVQVVAGKPVVIETKGTWVFRMNRVVSADGLEIPDVMKQFPLGSLVATIDPIAEPSVAASRRDEPPKTDADPFDFPPITLDDEKPAQKTTDASGPRPFLIGAKKTFTPAATGQLFLKIHDTQEADNSGELTVTISGQIRVQSGGGRHVAKSQK